MLNSYFKFKENGTDLKTEIIGGITTFLAMAYTLGINPPECLKQEYFFQQP